MDKKQKMAIVLLPLLSIGLLFGCNSLKGGDAPTAAYTDGTYEGTAKGFKDDITVAVTIAGGKISNIELVSINDTQGLGDEAAKKVIEAVIAAQGTEVDTVSGATFSSQGTIDAIKAALALASGGSSAAGSFTDGVYEGAAAGFGGDIKVKVTVSGGKITDIEVLEMKETAGLGDKAIETLKQAMLDTQSVDQDVVTGASKSSEGFMAAVKNALEGGAAADDNSAEAGADAEAPVSVDITALADGVYTGTAKGFKSDITLKVEVQSGKITKIDVVSEDETDGLGDAAITNIIDQVIAKQDVNADVISGASFSSEGAIKALIAALESTPAPIEVVEETTNPEPAKEEPKKEEPKKEEPKKEEPKKEEPKKEEPAPAASGYKDGTYKASSKDSFYGDPINVTITIKDGKITDVTIAENETPEFGGKAAKELAATIKNKQSADVDTISGATITSKAVIAAAKEALSQAK